MWEVFSMGETSAEIQSAIDRFNGGDAAALNDLFARAGERLRQKAHQMLANDRVHQREQTGDLVQETCMCLLRALTAVRDDGTPQYQVGTPQEFFRLSARMMRRILVDLARHHYGKEGSAANQANVPLGGSSSAPGITPPDTGNDPAALAEWRDLYERLYERIEALPQDQRDAIDVVKFGGYSQEEAAQVLGVSVSTVKRWLRAAMLTLIEELGDNLPGEL
jgi:RNA polymerase sigma-70 factor (ECF subfamily)